VCGLTGFWNQNDSSIKYKELLERAQTMAATINWRGPDSRGEWADEKTGISIAHRRLAVVDLTSAGHQPMVSASGRYVIAYNGEVYNSTEIRNDLKGRHISWRGHSDTETILEACGILGVSETVKKCIGMFAFAIWDRQERELWLVRDRLGIKPLYYGFNNGIFFFGSQIKTFLQHPAFRPEMNLFAVQEYLRFGYIPAPLSIWKDISKLTQGSWIKLSAGGTVDTGTYWDLETAVRKGMENRFTGTPEEAADELEMLLKDAVKCRMIADVPLGAFLSGGIDSSLVCALMQSQSSKPIKTFSIGFAEQGYNEAQYAKAVASHLGTEHHELYVSSAQAQAVIPVIPVWYDEPFADSSQIPTVLVSRLARQHVTVALSGDGGDELFAGYGRYTATEHAATFLKHIPFPMRSIAANCIRSVSPEKWHALASIFPEKSGLSKIVTRAWMYAEILLKQNFKDLYCHLVSHWQNPFPLVMGANGDNETKWNSKFNSQFLARREWMQYIDTITYLPDDILTKTDRASMSCSLELRVPIIDHRAVELSWRFPSKWKTDNGVTKRPLRHILYKYIPEKLIERPKMGFGIPLSTWLRTDLREWAEDLLNTKKMNEDGIFQPKQIRNRWIDHLSGNGDWDYPLWIILMFQAWKKNLPI